MAKATEWRGLESEDRRDQSAKRGEENILEEGNRECIALGARKAQKSEGPVGLSPQQEPGLRVRIWGTS